jgi:hypothetical protein
MSLTELREAAWPDGYLKGRIAQVYDSPNAKRPRWTVTDARAVQSLGRREEELQQEANRLTNLAEWAEEALGRIADEPPNRGLTPDFRRFARDSLARLARLRDTQDTSP